MVILLQGKCFFSQEGWPPINEVAAPRYIRNNPKQPKNELKIHILHSSQFERKTIKRVAPPKFSLVHEINGHVR